MPPKISLYELQNINKKKEIEKTKIYDKILSLCHKKIKKIATMGGNSVNYEIPNYIFGCPLYDIDKCISYVMENLKKDGLRVVRDNSSLFISWKN